MKRKNLEIAFDNDRATKFQHKSKQLQPLDKLLRELLGLRFSVWRRTPRMRRFRSERKRK